MSKINTILSISCILIFVITLILLNLAYGTGKRRRLHKVKKRQSLYRTLDLKMVVYLLLAAGAATCVINTISYSTITTSIVFVCLVAMAPYILANNAKRIHQEDVFQDVILYCQNMGMLLKQYHNVYMALSKVKDDLNTELAKDVESLMILMNRGENRAVIQEAMQDIEENYQYTCLKNLHLIMLHMQYENAKIEDDLIDTYQDDVAALANDVRINKSTRKTMRIQYIGISIGCILIYKFFLDSMKDTLVTQMNTFSFNVINSIFIFAVIISLFYIDRYFNAHITKE